MPLKARTTFRHYIKSTYILYLYNNLFNFIPSRQFHKIINKTRERLRAKEHNKLKLDGKLI